MLFGDYSKKRIQKWRTFRYLANTNPLRYKVEIEKDLSYNTPRFNKCGVLYMWVTDSNLIEEQGAFKTLGSSSGWTYLDKTSRIEEDSCTKDY